MKIPRKLKKQIPVGFYCYTGVEMDWKTGVYHIKPCPLYSHIKLEDIPLNKRPEWMDQEYIDEFGMDDTIGWCKLLNDDIDDQCKKCGLRYGL